MRRKTTEVAEAPFLDVVTNLIGILIIIIMVTGPRATGAMVEAAVDAKRAAAAAAKAAPGPKSPAAQAEPAAVAKAAADAVEKDIHVIDAKLKQQQFEIDYRRNERDKILGVLTAIQQEMQQEQQKLSTNQQAQLEANRELLAARTELQDLQASRDALERTPQATSVIEHRPTPMAKMVFGQEIHFRLQAGRVTYVPWEELVEALKKDVPERAWKLKDSARITQTLGPVRGFRMEYTLRRSTRLMSEGGGVTAGQTVELEKFVMLPLTDDLGEPLEQAFQSNSELRAVLSRYEAKRASVTVWVYPDSFAQFRELNDKLQELGFLTSARPMPDGHPIGGSPEGSRSAAQ